MPKKGNTADSEQSAQETPGLSSRRLPPDVREKQIVQKAIDHFATHGFSGSTRELARQLGVTQPLLYRYFPSKDALIDKVYEEVYRWDPAWEKMIKDRSIPLQSRMEQFYTAYARVILRREWIRIFIFAGLTREGINKKYLSKLRERVFSPVIAELHATHGLPEPMDDAGREIELELVWSLHASIFYMGVRKWIYGLPIVNDVDAHIVRLVDAFLNGTPSVLQSAHKRSKVKARS